MSKVKNEGIRELMIDTAEGKDFLHHLVHPFSFKRIVQLFAPLEMAVDCKPVYDIFESGLIHIAITDDVLMRLTAPGAGTHTISTAATVIQRMTAAQVVLWFPHPTLATECINDAYLLQTHPYSYGTARGFIARDPQNMDQSKYSIMCPDLRAFLELTDNRGTLRYAPALQKGGEVQTSSAWYRTINAVQNSSVRQPRSEVVSNIMSKLGVSVAFTNPDLFAATMKKLNPNFDVENFTNNMKMMTVITDENRYVPDKDEE